MKDKLYRLLLHVPVGGFNAWLICREPAAGVIFFLGFVIYELNEDWRIRDQAWKDLAGWLWGFALAVYIIAIL
jgi:hypothetical protein